MVVQENTWAHAHCARRRAHCERAIKIHLSSIDYTVKHVICSATVISVINGRKRVHRPIIRPKFINSIQLYFFRLKLLESY